MKNYRITVNGNVYDVTVEEIDGTNNNAAPAQKQAAAPKAAPAQNPAPAPKAAAPQGTGSIKINSAIPGKVLRIVASAGTSVKAGDQIIVLESMKMEIPVVAPQAGTVASIDAGVGADVQTGDLIATMNP